MMVEDEGQELTKNPAGLWVANEELHMLCMTGAMVGFGTKDGGDLSGCWEDTLGGKVEKKASRGFCTDPREG